MSLRLIREIHEVLLSQGRGSEKSPGAFRTSQNWINGTRPGNAQYVPPPPDHVMECLGSLETFIHDLPARTPTLTRRQRNGDDHGERGWLHERDRDNDGAGQ